MEQVQHGVRSTDAWQSLMRVGPEAAGDEEEHRPRYGAGSIGHATQSQEQQNRLSLWRQQRTELSWRSDAAAPDATGGEAPMPRDLGEGGASG